MKRVLIVVAVFIVASITMISLVFLLFWANGDRELAREFKSDGNILRYARDYWVNNGRPANFQLEEILGPPSDFFVFTNIVITTNGVFHCRFGVHRRFWPPGVLAITDEGQLIFVCSTNGEVTISPDDYDHWTYADSVIQKSNNPTIRLPGR